MRGRPVPVLAALALALALVAAAPARAEPAVWRVTDADTEMVLFGSVHALPPHVQWRSADIDTAIASADLVAFEILTPADEAEEWAMMAPLMTYMYARRPLREAVSATTWARLETFLTKRGMAPQAFDALRPWAAAMMLEIAAAESEGAASDLGVDAVLEASVAPGRRKEALDTPALLLSTIQALAAYGDAEGEALLVETLDWIEETENQPEWALEEAWAAGDTAAVAELVEEMRTEAPSLYKALMTDRNTAWVPALVRMMETESRVVVVVGAAHMSGPDGLPALLRAAGYTVEGP